MKTAFYGVSMWKSVFDKMVTQLIQEGQLSVTYPDKDTRVYGRKGSNAGQAAISLTTHATLRALCLRPELAMGESYMDGTFVVAEDDIEGLLGLLLRNRRPDAFPVWVRIVEKIRFAVRSFLTKNNLRKSRQNVAHHYDISDDLYRLFLDEDMQYSCAYFSDPDMSLEDAQKAKKAMIAAKLLIKPGMRVLDIGCGWGGMALTLARDYGAHVTGVTLSRNQLATAKARAKEAGLEDQTEFRLMDYRELNEKFDRIVSVGMLEHVGMPHYREYFAQVANLLSQEGVALIHTIGRTSPPMSQSPWINKYIFPGGYVPSLSELAPAVEESGLWTLDLEIWRLHYAKTLRIWRQRFDANIDIVRQSYDERFIRMWRYYLTACYMAFEEQHQAVFHFQMGHQRDAAPLTRDYLYRQGTGKSELEAAE